MNDRKLVAGSRGSRLALWQTRDVMARIDSPCELKIIRTSGDRFQRMALQGQSTTGFFTREIENDLRNGAIDFAVHSLKDLPTRIDPAFTIVACLERAAVSDLLLIHPDWLDADRLVPLKAGCRVGAGSLRRQSLIRRFAPWAEPDLIRGNVPTRIDKCLGGEYGALVIARAGVERLGIDWTPLTAFECDPGIWLPAPGQGAVAVEIRSDDDLPALTAIDHGATRAAVTLERQLLENFEGGCHTAFGAYAESAGGEWRVRLGLDSGDRGWLATEVTGSLDVCSCVGPSSKGLRMDVPQVQTRDELLRPVSPFSE